MKIILFGSTGSIGQLVIQQALQQGHAITAYSRDPSKLNRQHDQLIPFQGNIHDQNAVNRAVEKQDAVICALGMPLFNNNKLRTKGTKNIIEAMDTAGITRLICLSSMGVGDSHKLLPPVYKYIIAPLLMRRLLADHARQEHLIKQSKLDWTIIRPGNFISKPIADHYTTDFTSTKPKAKITRPHVAEFLLKQLTTKANIHKSPSISY